MQQTINIPEGFELIQTSETTYEIKKKNNLPETWEEFCETHPISKGEHYINIESGITPRISPNSRFTFSDRNVLPSKSDAEGILALMQLIQLRDCYNDGWKPDWKNVQNDKYIIYYFGEGIGVGINDTTSRTLSFKTPELRDKFLTNFKDLIETAKDFI